MAASVLISETTRCGPHCISTCAITRSLTTAVTSPTNRLRAERSTPDGSDGGRAAERANSASATPSITSRLESSRLDGSLPASMLRRTVSSLTPNSAAASDTRKYATRAAYAAECPSFAARPPPR